MKKKQVFKTVATHLLTQNSKSTADDSDNCQYQNNDGKQCAVGVLIDSKNYQPTLEGTATDDIEVIQAVEKSLDTHITKSDRDLLCKLQDIHDYSTVEGWRSQLEELADREFNKTLEDLGVSV
tara:strand:+ start:14 stop:382 length:369 start_codon:yes stop_codon:yes gene_type:complete